MSGHGGTPLVRTPQKPARRNGPAPGQRLLALGLTIAAHLVVIAALFWPRPQPSSPPPQPAALRLTLVDVPRPQPPGPPDPAPAPLHLAALPPVQAVAPVLTVAPADTSDLLSEAQLAGAAGADGEGSGGGGGGCDTARAVQLALRRDPLVRVSVEDAHRLGKSVLLWNGDWVRSGEQDGKGLSAVREAIIWALAFAPQACRNRPLHGLVLLSLADGNTRFGIGAGDWRWSDLLGVRAAR